MKEVLSTTGFQFTNFCEYFIKDGVSKSIVLLLGIEEETCYMHDTDKIEKYAIG